MNLDKLIIYFLNLCVVGAIAYIYLFSVADGTPTIVLKSVSIFLLDILLITSTILLKDVLPRKIIISILVFILLMMLFSLYYFN